MVSSAIIGQNARGLLTVRVILPILDSIGIERFSDIRCLDSIAEVIVVVQCFVSVGVDIAD